MKSYYDIKIKWTTELNREKKIVECVELVECVEIVECRGEVVQLYTLSVV